MSACFDKMKICGVSLETDERKIAMERCSASTWGAGPFAVSVDAGETPGLTISSDDPSASLKFVDIRWSREFRSGAKFLGDAVERSYGDLGWRGVEPDRGMPWYFIESDGEARLAGFGVKTGASSLCVWRADSHGFSLRLDLRCGTRGVILGTRVLKAAELVFLRSEKGECSFSFAKRFVSSLAKGSFFPKTPVFGFNDWYYSYGKSTAETILRDSSLCGELASGLPFKPYSVIDDGWEYSASQASPWSMSAKIFPNMEKLAAEIEKLGCLPGIWYRPLLTSERLPAGRTLNASRFSSPNANRSETILDPSVPENLEIVKTDARRFKDWGYKLIKHDFSSWDLFGKWGFEMRDGLSSGDWSFADRSKTNAEIISGFYAALNEGADGSLVVACDAIGHLAAGHAQINRIGDDASGREWSRTRKMCVNSLAFRALQHKAFFMDDADCAGITKAIPWRLNAQWIDLLSRSGTALFVSASPDAVGPEQKAFLKDAFAKACCDWPVPEPLDWFDGSCPELWRLGDDIVKFNWSE